MKNIFLLSFSVFSLLTLLACSLSQNVHALGSSSPEPPRVVDYVDVERYMGLWYEVARFEQSFQKGCVGVTAEYTLGGDNKVTVLNSCYQESLDGKKRQAAGRAYIKDKETNAKLRVSFFWPFYGDYWIFILDENYEYAVVGSPDRGSLWFLSRSPHMDDETFEKLSSKMSARGFDMSRLQKTLQR